VAIQNLLTLVENGASFEDVTARRSPRVRVLINARIITTTDEQPVKLRDISAGGTLVQSEQPLAAGKDVILRRGSTELFARIVWAKGKKCGLQFEDTLSEAELLGFIHQPPRAHAQMPQPLPKRASLAAEPLTPEQWDIIQAWGRPAGRDAHGE
jgi:hypothetical protein